LYDVYNIQANSYFWFVSSVAWLLAGLRFGFSPLYQYCGISPLPSRSSNEENHLYLELSPTVNCSDCAGS
jgi:hypothetical protein